MSSASLLKTLREAENRRELKQCRPLPAFADPIYPACGRKPNPAAGAEIRALRTRAYQSIANRGGAQACFPPLPKTAAEAEDIAKLLKADLKNKPSSLYLREQVSKAKIFALNEEKRLDDYRYVRLSGKRKVDCCLLL
ncbi:MAG: hypothetical protein GY862_17225 [Gammaproteobacteria bacterium]|nr:hypothetical protein [Gammaproteobacteria bacterium]